MIRRIVCALAAVGCIIGTPVLGEDAAPDEVHGMPLLYATDFDKGTGDWTMTDPNAWEIAEDEGVTVLSLHQPSNYEPPVRSPLNIALLKNIEVSDIVLEVRCKQTGREYGHRDLCFFFGYQGPSRFYYAHLATKADEHANSIFRVNDAPRISIATDRTDGTDWGTGYQTVRVVRDSNAGTIEVFFNDMDTPIMTATDDAFTTGQVGIGSFDDVGYFDSLRLWGRKADASAEAGDTP